MNSNLHSTRHRAITCPVLFGSISLFNDAWVEQEWTFSLGVELIVEAAPLPRDLLNNLLEFVAIIFISTHKVEWLFLRENLESEVAIDVDAIIDTHT